MPRLAIVGMGKMGRAVEQLARERGFEVVARLGKGDTISRATLAEAEVAVEFTAPRAAPANIKAVIEAGCPIVVGTTGWYESRADVDACVTAQRGALLVAPNFSPGIAAFGEIVKAAARILKTMPGFDAHIIETHHAAKKDTPSGTSVAIEESAAAVWGANIPVTSVRSGSVPGTHEVLFDAPFEQIQLVHSARDRRVFAEGALHAARWLIGRTGIFTMRDVISQ